MAAEVVEERLRLLAGIHGELEELGLDAGRLQGLDLGVGALAAGGVAGLLVADHDPALDAHREQPLGGQLAGGPLVRAGAEQEDVVRVADLRALAGGRRRGAAERDPGLLGARGDVGIGGILGELAERDAVGLGRDRLLDLLDLVRDGELVRDRCR